MSTILFFFSYQCPYSKQMLHTIDTHQLSVVKVCVDDKTIRSKITKSKDFSISKVPSFIVIHSETEEIDMYEDNAQDILQLLLNEKKEKDKLDQQQKVTRLTQQTRHRDEHTNIVVNHDINDDIGENIKTSGIKNKNKKSAKEIAKEMLKERELELNQKSMQV